VIACVRLLGDAQSEPSDPYELDNFLI
jgi:hypothetical protein